MAENFSNLMRTLIYQFQQTPSRANAEFHKKIPHSKNTESKKRKINFHFVSKPNKINN